MSLGEEKKETVQFQMVPPGYAMVYPQQFAQHSINQQQPVPVYYAPQYAQTTPSGATEDSARLVQNETKEAQEGCKKRWGEMCKWKKGCCWTDDGRPFGTFIDFVSTLTLGSFFPILSLILVFGMETSKLSRTGVMFGHANFFFGLSAILLAVAHHHHVHGSVIVLSAVVGLIFLIISLKKFRKFLYFYRTRESKPERELVKVISQVGSCKEFVMCFVISFFFSVIGTLILIAARRKYLYSRYGAVCGFGFNLIFCGIHWALNGVPVPLIAGLVILELALVHFRRAIVCAEVAAPSAATTA
jgi:hypothetical protein